MKNKIGSVFLVSSLIVLSSQSANAGGLFSSCRSQASLDHAQKMEELAQGKSIHAFLSYLYGRKVNALSVRSLLKVDQILGNGAPVDERDVKGFTPLKLAIDHGDFLLMKRLLAHGADPLLVKQLDIEEDLILFHLQAVGMNHFGGLVVRNDDISAGDVPKYIGYARDSKSIADLVTHIHSIQEPWLKKSELTIVESLLKQGASVNQVDLYGVSPLASAVQHFDVKLTQLLIKYGANSKAMYVESQLGRDSASYKKHVVSFWGHGQEKYVRKDPGQKSIIDQANFRLTALVEAMKEARSMGDFYRYMEEMMPLQEIVDLLNRKAASL